MLPVPTRDVLLLCVFLAAIHVASSCMCMPSHPQTDICREDSFGERKLRDCSIFAVKQVMEYFY